MIKLYHRFTELWFKLLSFIAVLTVVAMLTIMTIEVVRRYIFGMTFIWSDEVIRILLIFCAFFGGSAAYYKHNLVSFDLVTNKFSDKVQKILLLVTNIVLSIFFIFLTYYTFQKMTAPSVVSSISTATGFTAAVPYYGIFLGLISLMIFTIDFYPVLISNVFFKHKAEED